MSVINHKNANKNIINKAKNLIPRTLSLMEYPNHNIRVFYYSDKDKNKQVQNRYSYVFIIQ